MALPPTIPTSFVPKQPVHTAPKKRAAGPNPFYALAYFVLGVAIVGAIGVFAYKTLLTGIAHKKQADVATAEGQIDRATVESFIRLRDRFTTASDILNHHVELSQFFDSLEANTVQGVKFKSLHITVADDRKATLTLTGQARSFNALAAQSTAFGKDTRIKQAIFSGIAVDGTTGFVSFTVNAVLDPSIVQLPAAGAAMAPAPSAPAATSTAPAAPAAKAATTTKP